VTCYIEEGLPSTLLLFVACSTDSKNIYALNYMTVNSVMFFSYSLVCTYLPISGNIIPA
jgi:hypothetical protein